MCPPIQKMFEISCPSTAASSSLQDVATLVLCMQVTIFGLCFTGPMFNTQLGILFWAVTGALYGAVLGLQDQSHDNSGLDRV